MQKRNLDEISFIRPILIVLLVIVHCFTVFNGGWPPFTGFKESAIYMWLSRLCYSFMLEMFIFISGYVWAYQVLNLHTETSLSALVKKKVERLILPSVVFSLLYYYLLNNECVVNFGGGTFCTFRSWSSLVSTSSFLVFYCDVDCRKNYGK